MCNNYFQISALPWPLGFSQISVLQVLSGAILFPDYLPLN